LACPFAYSFTSSEEAPEKVAASDWREENSSHSLRAIVSDDFKNQIFSAKDFSTVCRVWNWINEKTLTALLSVNGTFWP
jgi:hypothetical protein